MTRATAVAFALLLISVTPLFAADSVSFTSTDVAAGETWVESGTYTSSMSVTTNDGTVTRPATTQNVNVTRSKTMTILAVGGDSRIDSLQVAYSIASPAVVAGKSYTLSVQGQKVSDVAYSDTSLGPVPAAEDAFVRKDNAHFGQFRALNRIFGGDTYTVGDAVKHINKTNAEELVNASAGMAVDDLTLQLQSVSGDGANRVAVFATSLTLKGNLKSNSSPGDKTKDKEKFASDVVMTLNGTISVKVNCRPVRMNLSGNNTLHATIAASGPASRGFDKMTMDGTGTASFDFNYSF